ncbi:MAG: ATP-binding protein, partial [Planctomycetota bacterium]
MAAESVFPSSLDATPPPELLESESTLAQMAFAFFSTPGTPGKKVEAAPVRRVHTPEGVLVVEDSLAIESLDAGAQRLLGVSLSEVAGRTLDAFLQVQDRASGSNEAACSVSGGVLTIAPGVSGRRRDGTTFPLEASTATMRIAGATRHIVTLRDVTERLRADDELQKSQARYKMLVEQIPAVTFMAALDDGINEIYIGPQIETLLGFTQQEWLDSPVLWYWQLHPDDRQRWNEEFARGVQTGGPFRSECRFIAKNGEIVWVHGEARVVRDEHGKPLFVQGVAFDITEAKNAEAKVREAQDVMARSERLAAIGQLAGGVAHDLRNPLGAIRNAWFFISKKVSLAEAAKADPRVARMGELIDGELNRCAKIIGDLLDFARERAPYRVACPVATLVKDSVSVVAKPSPAIQIVEEIAPNLPIPYLDGDQFRQVVVNLIQNAVEAVDPQKGCVTVSARSVDAATLAIEIADNGKRIPKDIRAKIFEPLFTTKTKGTGLGLSIVDAIVRRHGGRIELDSEAGRGTTFR